MNQLTSAKRLSEENARSWQTSAQNPQHTSLRSLTTSPHSTRRSASVEEDPKEKGKEKRREIAASLESLQACWLRPTSNFIPAPELGRPPGGSSPVIHFFRDHETGARWIGKLGQVPLRDKEVLEAARRSPGFLGVYADEILEKLGLAVYQLLGTEVPESTLSYQQVTMEAMHPDMLLAMQLNAEDEGRVFELPHSPRMHYLSRFVDDFQSLEPDFVQEYIVKAKSCGKEYVKIQTWTGELLPLKGLGSMLAAADFVYDLDCLGDSCGNAGYVIREDRATGERYAQLVKIDAGYAFSYSDLRTDQRHNPRDRQIRVAPNQLRLQFADLAPADQREFAVAAKRILSIPYEEFAHLFSQTEGMKEGISFHHWQQLLDELIARKSLFLKAFAPETDRAIVKEIEAAQAKVAKQLEHTEEVSAQVVEEVLAQEKEEAIALAELRVRLAVVDMKESEPKKVGECKTFQLSSTNTHFVGREEALAEVVRQLNQTNGSVIGQSISGIGGVGKTQLALHYAQAAANGEAVGGQYLGYDYVVWLNAEVFLEGQFQAMAEVWTGKQLKAGDAIEAVYRYLRGKRALLVFDNAENARSIAAFLPPDRYASPVHFLITSRSAEWGELPTVKLEGFSLEEACQYIEYHLGPQPKEAVKKLLELVEGLPLAMSQAVSYIKAGHCTLEAFEEEFYLNQANLLSHELIEEELHPKTVGTTLTLSLAKAKVQNSIVEKLLGVVAYLAPEGIHVELLTISLEVSREEVEQAIEILESYSLVNRKRGEVQVHRLVQEVMRHRHKFLRRPQSYWNKVVGLLSEVVFYDETRLEEMRSCSHAIAHVLQMAKLSKGCDISKEQELSLVQLLERSGVHQQIMGNYQVARDCHEQELEIVERYYGSDHAQVAITSCFLSKAYGALGDASKCKELLERSFIINERHYGNDHPEIAKTLAGLANAYGDLGDVRRKKELLERALGINESYYGPGNSEVAAILVKLGSAYGELGEPRKMRDLLKRALMINESCFGSIHPEVANTLVILGQAYSDLGHAVKNKTLLERALRIKESYYGSDHPKVAIMLCILSNIYYKLSDARKSKELLERALIIQEFNYGLDHPEVAKTLGSLGSVYEELGDRCKKKNFLERALSINECFFGPDHIKIVETLVRLGNTYGALGDVRKEKELLDRARVICESYYGYFHPEVAQVLVYAGGACGDLCDFRRERGLLERALMMYENCYDANHPKIAAALVDLSRAYAGPDDVHKQKELLERALSINESYYGPDNPKVVTTLVSLACAYREPEDARKKIELLERAISITESCYGPDNPKVAVILKHLGNAYGALNNAGKKKELLERALIIIENYYGPDYPSVAETSYHLADVCLKLKEYAKGKCYAQNAYLIFSQFYGEAHSNTEKASYMLHKCEKAEEMESSPFSSNKEEASSDMKTSLLDYPLSIDLLEEGDAYESLEKARDEKDDWETILAIDKYLHGNDSLQVARGSFRIAKIYGALGDNSNKKELLQRALTIFESQPSPSQLEIAITLFNLAHAYLALQECGQAKEYAYKVTEIFSEQFEDSHPNIKKAKGLLRLCEEQSKTIHFPGSSEQKEILPAMQMPSLLDESEIRNLHNHGKVVKIDNDQTKVAVGEFNFDSVYNSLEEAEKEKELLECALISDEQYYGSDHVGVARVLFKLGNAYGALGEAKKKIELLERSLLIDERNYGSEHPLIAVTLLNLGNAYGAVGNVIKKKELLERALGINERFYGRVHPSVVVTLLNLGYTYGELGIAQKKKGLLESALGIAEQFYGSDHLEVVKILGEVIEAYAEWRDVRKQKDLLERTVQIKERHYGSNHPEVAGTLVYLSEVCLTLKEYEKANDYAHRANAIFSGFCGEEHPESGRVQELFQRYEEQVSQDQSEKNEIGASQPTPTGSSSPTSCVIS